ncbi:F-type H+-transporting ATPase subunit delta [Methylohalomonas lacus]|uniref:ATP synthase subunit delta n=1 Tax=Methylohalomonas lacus TaxID=398773 RepID=A0AAE3L1E0_9GAMM|nr:F0F1 ATP synthase subunit delta [Methylohalomonas lacus]MCS3903445.1 F-type H+-transporting ATPase subunit delta [Methylohalomonas lacus]
MLEKTTIARPYAEAAFEQAREEGTLKSWSELLSVLAVAVSDKQMHALLQNPRVTAAQLLDIVSGIAGGELSETQRNFLQVLVEAERLQFAPEMKTLFEANRLDAEGLANVEVVSAYPLEDAQRSRITDAMAKRLDRKIELTESTDEKLIGGAVIRNGDSVIDASIRGQLEELRSELA